MAIDSVPEPARLVDASEPVPHARPAEAWILAGTIDGRACVPALDADVAGLPHVFRLAAELALAGIPTAYVISPEPLAPALAAMLRDDDRLAKIKVSVVPEPPPGAVGDGIVIVRADRIFHRDLPKAAITAFTGSSARIAMVAGEHDGVVVTDRTFAKRLAAVIAEPGRFTAELREIVDDDVVLAPEPYLAFTTTAPDRRALRRAERRLVWSLRKGADGIASKLINRYLSLPITWLLMRTRVLPNHVTLCALACALAGSVVIAQGGFAAGAAGMLLVELGSIVDGIDGELARLKFLFSKTGQWLDTVVDDIANVCYSGGIMLNLHAAGIAWALPLWAAAAIGFVLTQSSQYWLIRRVYNSGDLAAIPWAFQSTAFLSQRPRGFVPWLKATAPKLLKRDTAVTVFTVFALAGHLDWVLVGYSAGALLFFAVFFVQFARNAGSVRRALRAR
ncbi:MAG TPA: CDP-alcohol phosphatidyltransferase family protein [Kofleriaceae bacterium]